MQVFVIIPDWIFAGILGFWRKKKKENDNVENSCQEITDNERPDELFQNRAPYSTQNGQLDIIIDGLKVANCISRAPARSIIRHKDKIHFDVLFYSIRHPAIKTEMADV